MSKFVPHFSKPSKLFPLYKLVYNIIPQTLRSTPSASELFLPLSWWVWSFPSPLCPSPSVIQNIKCPSHICKSTHIWSSRVETDGKVAPHIPPNLWHHLLSDFFLFSHPTRNGLNPDTVSDKSSQNHTRLISKEFYITPRWYDDLMIVKSQDDFENVDEIKRQFYLYLSCCLGRSVHIQSSTDFERAQTVTFVYTSFNSQPLPFSASCKSHLSAHHAMTYVIHSSKTRLVRQNKIRQ